MRLMSILFLMLNVMFFSISCSSHSLAVKINADNERVMCIDVSPDGGGYVDGIYLEIGSYKKFIAHLIASKDLSAIEIRGAKSVKMQDLQPFFDVSCQPGIRSIILRLTDLSIDQLSKPVGAQKASMGQIPD